MSRLALLAVSLSLIAIMINGWASTSVSTSQLARPAESREVMEAEPDTSAPLVGFCFAPGTPDSYMAEVQRRAWGDHYLDYFLGGRWDRTATNQNTGVEGQPITLTYSFVPDGVLISDQWGTGPSVLFARMNALFGNESAWQTKFAEVFAEWSRVTGVQYIHDSDDGASFPNTRGQLGVRGDIRIACKTMDGPNNVLAQTWFPDRGDIEFDASENWAESGQNFIFLRNVAAHEHGHSLGLEHVCPIDQTKLLEPYYSSAFDGPQHDDIRAANRNYGDRYEPNNTAATATNLGTLSQDSSLQNVSLDHVTDEDWFSFAIPAGKGFTLTLQPVGYTYLNGPQNDDGSCSDGTPLNSLNILDLGIFLYDASGNTLLAQSDSHPAGEAERIFHYPVSPTGGSFKARTVGSGGDDVQIYRLDFSLFNLDDPYLSLDPIDFDTTRINTPVTMTTQLINRASTVRHVSAVNSDGPFTVSPSGPLTIAPNDSVAFSVTYTAALLGTQTGTLTITHDGPSGTLQCPLSGTSIGVWLQFVVSNTVNLGSVPVGSMDSVRVPIRAVGNIPLAITSFEATLPFSIRLNLPLVINPNQTVFIYPRFAPTIEGPAQGTILFHHNGVTSTDTMYVSGTATPSAADDRPAQLPAAFHLAQNYPNPFNPTTTIAFDLPRATNVRVQVYDIEGRLVKELVNGNMEAGHHSFSFDATNLPSGVYIYRLTSPEYRAMNKMALIK